LQTNDPKHRVIQVVVTATVKPLPAFVKRISNADIQHGDKIGSFIVWPTARPVIPMEKGERLPISLRIRPDAPGQSVTLAAASDTVKLTRETNGDGYVLDVTVESPADAPSRVLPLVVNVEGGQALTLQVTAKAQTEGLVTSSRQVDFGEVSLANVQSGSAPLARLGVRKPVGTFEVKAVTASLDFLRVEAQTIVPGSNYVIYIRFDTARLPKPATYIGTLHIETTDAAQPQLELPVKVIVTK
jgi:hypothetical protein